MQSASRIVLLLTAASLAVAAPLARGTSGPSRGDLDLARRKVAVLESELSLARSRKPYLVVDAQGKTLRYRLLGVTMREIPLSGLRIDGLARQEDRDSEGALTLAGIVTLKEKEKDPRLSPLTPEQIEAGAADENVADALPPEAPADFEVEFKQPLTLRVEGVAAKTSVWSGPGSWLSRLWRGGGKGKEPRVRLTAHLDETAARELYRSLIPGTRLLLVPPAGFRLPDIGQESPRSVSKGRPPRAQPSQPTAPPQDVPFRIPPPVAESPADGTTTAVEEPDGSTGNGSAPSGVEEPQPTPDQERPADPAASPAPESGGGA